MARHPLPSTSSATNPGSCCLSLAKQTEPVSIRGLEPGPVLSHLRACRQPCGRL